MSHFNLILGWGADCKSCPPISQIRKQRLRETESWSTEQAENPRLEHGSPHATSTPLLFLQFGVLRTSVARAPFLRKTECFLYGCFIPAHAQGWANAGGPIASVGLVKHTGSQHSPGTMLNLPVSDFSSAQWGGLTCRAVVIPSSSAS